MTPLPRPESPLAPKYWRHEDSGLLASALQLYFDNPESMTMREVAVVRVYLRQWIQSPVWGGDEVEVLRKSVDCIWSPRSIREWLDAARDLGIDPL